jgi:hypothetical protein
VIGATLVVANVFPPDSHSRFHGAPGRGGVEVRFCDLPRRDQRGRFMLRQMLAVAELEAGLISERTKKALGAARASAGFNLSHARRSHSEIRCSMAFQNATFLVERKKGAPADPKRPGCIPGRTVDPCRRRINRIRMPDARASDCSRSDTEAAQRVLAPRGHGVRSALGCASNLYKEVLLRRVKYQIAAATTSGGLRIDLAPTLEPYSAGRHRRRSGSCPPPQM